MFEWLKSKNPLKKSLVSELQELTDGANIKKIKDNQDRADRQFDNILVGIKSWAAAGDSCYYDSCWPFGYYADVTEHQQSILKKLNDLGLRASIDEKSRDLCVSWEKK